MSRCMTLVNNGIASRKKLEHSHDSPASSQLGQSAPGQSRSTPSKRFTLALLLAAISLNNDDKPDTSSPLFACLKYRPPSTPLHGRSKPATLQFYRLLGNFQPRSFTVMAHLNRKRLIRRAPLRDRIMAYFDPHDIDIWLREKLEAADWDAFHKRNGTPLGIALNVTALVARLSSGTRNGNEYDDLYIEEDEGSSFWSWLASTVYATLVLLSLLNALYLFRRKRNYRLFELPIEEVPPTPSANLVPVDSSPSSSPLRLLSSFIPSISQRVKPSESSVWEVSTWDPFPLCLTILTYFSPLHLLLYQLQLPGSLTILLSTTIFSAALSLLLNHLITSFQLLSSDTALLQAQLFKEYNIKYVLPRLNPEVRNAAVQCQPSSIPGHSDPVSRVFLSTPTTNIRRAFRPNPNPLYDSDTDLSHLVNDEGELNASAGSGGWSGRSSLGGENRRSSGGPGTFLTPSFLSRPGNAFGRKPDPSPHKPDLHRSIFSSPLAGPTMLQNQRLPTIPGTPQANTSNSSGHCPPGGPDSSPLRGPTARVIHVTSGGVQTLDGAPFAFTKTNGARRDAAIATSASALEQAERFPRIRHASPVKHTTRQAASAAVTNGAGMTTGISNGVNVSVNSNGNGNSNGSAEGGYLGVYSHAHSPLKKGFRQNGALAAAEESPVRGAARAGNHAQARRERGY